METVGLIGVGLLGAALAERMLAAGFRVIGYDLAEPQREALAQAGGTAVESAADVVAACDVIVLSLPDSSVVASVVDSLGDAWRAGQTIIDTTTGEPRQTADLGAVLQKRGIHYLDATILGSSEQVRTGAATAMIGGTDEAVRSVAEVIDSFAVQRFHVGPCGSGAKMKLVVNLVLGLNRAVLAEGLTLAKALGLDWPRCLEVLRSGAAYSAAMDTKGEKMIRGDFAPQARLSQHLKDVRLMLAAAERTGTELPLSNVHRDLLERAEAAGFGDLDNSAVLRVFGS